jgi:hypothetical protein
MKKMISLWSCIIVLFTSSILQCNSKGSKTENSYKKDSCATIYAEDKLAYEIFKNIHAKDYNKIISLKAPEVKISFEPVKNAFDSTRIDSVVNIKIGNTSFKYYSRKESKVLLEAIISDDRLPISNEIKIGMSRTAFESGVLSKYFRQKISTSTNCIDISPPSDYENLHFLFAADKLVSVSYTCSIESFK